MQTLQIHKNDEGTVHALWPAWHMKSGITRWKALPLKWRGLPDLPVPFSPVHKQRKFSAVFGATSARSSITMRPAALPPMVMSLVTEQTEPLGMWSSLHTHTHTAVSAQHTKTSRNTEAQRRPWGWTWCWTASEAVYLPMNLRKRLR